MKYLPEGVERAFGKAKCITLETRQRHNTLGKHEKHESHFWWYIGEGGGHELLPEYVDQVFINGTGLSGTENVFLHECSGR